MTYQMRAYRFIRAMFDFVENWTDVHALEYALEEMYWRVGEEAILEMGSSRMVIVGEDFAIKWDYDEENVRKTGGCEDEFRKYRISLSSGYAYLLAPIFRVYYRQHYFFIMPRVDEVGSGEKNIFDFISGDESMWLAEHVGDLHSWNWGMLNGRPVIIDYACCPDWG